METLTIVVLVKHHADFPRFPEIYVTLGHVNKRVTAVCLPSGARQRLRRRRARLEGTFAPSLLEFDRLGRH